MGFAVLLSVTFWIILLWSLNYIPNQRVGKAMIFLWVSYFAIDYLITPVVALISRRLYMNFKPLRE